MKLTDLLLPGEYEGTLPDAEITEIVNDNERIVPGCLFVCHEGARFDSHSLLPTLSGRGCVAAVVQAGKAVPDIPFPVVRVPDTRLAEALIANRMAGEPGKKLTMIGVTGTNGKTSVSFMLHRLFCDAHIPCGLIGTLGFFGAREKENAFTGFHTGNAATMTTPPPLTLYPLLAAMVESGITHVVMEVSSQGLIASRVAPLHFSLSVFTNLSPEHLDAHKTMGNYLAAKSVLFRQTDIAVVNGDSPWSDLLLDRLPCKRISCSTVRSSDAEAVDVRLLGSEGVSYIYRTRERSFPVTVPVPGEFAVQNSLLALTAALSLGVDPGTAKRSIAVLPPIPGRMERIDTGDFPFSVFIDYAHTEAALRSLLRTVRGFRSKNERIVLLFGCGGDRDKTKRAEMGRVAEELADFTVVTSDNSRSEDPKRIILDILSGMKNQRRRLVILNRERAIRYLILSAEPGDVILLVGKGHEKYEITKDGSRPFDEKKIVLSALEERRAGHTIKDLGHADQLRDST